VSRPMRHLKRLLPPIVHWEVVGWARDGNSHCVRRAILLHLSTSVAQLHDMSHVQTGKCTNDYSNNGQLLVQHPLSSSLARSLNNSRKCSVIHSRHDYDVHHVRAFVERNMGANHQGSGGGYVVGAGYTVGGHRCPLAVRVAL